ncbi:MAG: hypothetical protein ACRDJM_00925 [Actinomycetota bacterium]
MAVLWGLPAWVWITVAGIAFCASLVILRVLRAAFAAVRELGESLELSSQVLRTTLEATRDEVTRAQEGLQRLGRREERAEASQDR